MNIGLDTGSPDELRQYLDWELPLKKITTNPTTCAATINTGRYRTPFDIWEDMLAIADGVLISGETLGSPSYDPDNLSADLFVDEALAISELDSRMVVKLPAVTEALEAAARLKQRIKINYTLVFSLHQAMLAADYGGLFVSPFVGRYDDKLKKLGLPGEGMDLAREIIAHYRNEKFPTYVLTASVRTKKHIDDAFAAGSHYITIPFTLVKSLKEEMGTRRLQEYLWSMQSIVPSNNRRKASYRMRCDESRMKAYEVELRDDGMKRFLDDAKAANYFVIPPATATGR